MKKVLMLAFILSTNNLLFAQTKQVYPTPEFNNEINFLNKEKMILMRLEKGTSKMQSKTKMGGMGGGESGYSLGGAKSPVRIPASNNLSFVFSTGSGAGSTPEADSIMKANGMDPSMRSGMSEGLDMMNDPSRTTSLYNMNTEKGDRKVTMQSYGGMKLFGKSKKESTKYTLSIKKIKEGYYEMIVDKPLPKGEYAFVQMNFSSMDGSTLLFAFGVD
jgi:hypothetical protein